MSSPDFFGALSNPVRRRILELLLEKPLPAGEIADAFDLKRPAVSEHLQVLRLAGLVREESQGRRRIYHLEAEGLADVEAWLQPFSRYWRARLRALNRVLAKEDE